MAGCSVFEAPITVVETDAGNIKPVDDAQVADDTSVPVGGDDAAVTTPDATVADSQIPVPVVDSAVPADTGAPQPDTGAPDAGPASCVIAGLDPMDECTGSVVINEIDGSGEDFIEIYNRGTVPVNIGNWVITDTSGGSPAVAEGVIIPPGTVLDPNRYLYVWANLTNAMTGLNANCIPSTPTPCLNSAWGISAQGERVYLLNADLTVVCGVSYPSGILAPEAFGRIPDGSSMLCPTTPSAGNPNVRSTSRP